MAVDIPWVVKVRRCPLSYLFVSIRHKNVCDIYQACSVILYVAFMEKVQSIKSTQIRPGLFVRELARCLSKVKGHLAF